MMSSHDERPSLHAWQPKLHIFDLVDFPHEVSLADDKKIGDIVRRFNGITRAKREGICKIIKELGGGPKTMREFGGNKMTNGKPRKTVGSDITRPIRWLREQGLVVSGSKGPGNGGCEITSLGRMLSFLIEVSEERKSL